VDFAEIFQKKVVTTCQVEYFRISHIILTCFHCFLPANTIEKKLVELQFYQPSHILAIFKVSKQ